MTLSNNARSRLRVALASKTYGDEVADAINVGGNPVSDYVAPLGVTSNMSALVVTATSLTALVVTATNVAASNFTAGNAAEPTKAEIDAGIDVVVLAIEGALDLKADNADVETLRTECQTAFGLKADNADVETLRTQAEARIDAAEAKIDSIIAELIEAGLMAAS